MEKIYYGALAIHIISILGILGLLLAQVQKSPRKLNPGVIHASLLALVAGIVMVSLFTEVKPDEVLNHTKIGVKTLIVTAILFLGYKNVKKEVIKTPVWGTMLGLTALNIFIAVGWM